MHPLLVLFSSEDGQDIAEYAVMLAVILLIVVGTPRIIGSNSNTACPCIFQMEHAYASAKHLQRNLAPLIGHLTKHHLRSGSNRRDQSSIHGRRAP
jgi:hypothetical protein